MARYRSRYSFAALMGSAPFGLVRQLRCCMLTAFALFIRCAHWKCSLWSRQAASLLFAHCVRVIHSLRSWEVLPLVASLRCLLLTAFALFIRCAHGTPFGRVSQLRCCLLTAFALFIRCAHGKCSLWSRYSCVGSRRSWEYCVIHSLRSWEVLPLVASGSFAVVCSLRSRYSFATLMGSAPFGRVQSLRCYLLTAFALSLASLMVMLPLVALNCLGCCKLATFALFIRSLNDY